MRRLDETVGRPDEAAWRLERRQGARRGLPLLVFGSTARDQATAKSDLDLFIDYDFSSTFSGFELVDVTTRDSLHPLLREDIERFAARVF